MSPPTSVTLFSFLLRLLPVFNLVTCLIRNILAIIPLAAGVGAVNRIRPLRCKGLTAAFTDPVLPFFQPPLLQILLISPVSAQVIITIFLAGDLSVEDATTTFADDFPNRQVRLHPGDFFLIPLPQRFLIFVFPITIPHGISPSFHRAGRAKTI